MESGPGYPIYMIRTHDDITLFDNEGEEIRKVQRTEHDEFFLNNTHSSFMLVQDQPVIESALDEHIYSFQVYNAEGAQEYTSVFKTDYTTGKLRYQLTDKAGILITEEGKPWLLEMSGEDTLLYIDSAQPKGQPKCHPLIMAANLKLENEMMIASSCLPGDSLESPEVELRIWDGAKALSDIQKIEGELHGIQGIPGSDYFFLELDHGDESSLTLFNRLTPIITYPWRTWEIRSLGQEETFIVSETDLNVINLGDGALSATYHPIELRGISDAAYMKEWDIFFYLRYTLFFTKEGKQAFRNFILEGVDQAGFIVHRSSFGSWSTRLPRVSVVGQDKFAIHIHNAVLLYQISAEPN